MITYDVLERVSYTSRERSFTAMKGICFGFATATVLVPAYISDAYYLAKSSHSDTENETVPSYAIC